MADGGYKLTPEDAERCEEITGRALGVVSGIARAVSDATGIRLGEIMGQSRKRPIVEARHLVMFLARQQGITYTAIAAAMRKDHTTIVHGVRCEIARRRQR